MEGIEKERRVERGKEDENLKECERLGRGRKERRRGRLLIGKKSREIEKEKVINRGEKGEMY